MNDRVKVKVRRVSTLFRGSCNYRAEDSLSYIDYIVDFHATSNDSRCCVEKIKFTAGFNSIYWNAVTGEIRYSVIFFKIFHKCINARDLFRDDISSRA